MKSFSFLLVLIIISLFTASLVFSQRGRNRQMMYNLDTVATYTGTVKKVDNINSKRGNMGVRIDLLVDGKTYRVHIGPQFYLTKQNLSIQVDDKLTIKGSKVTMNKAEVIIAGEITKDGKVVKLRDANGRPLWAGQRRGMGQGQGRGYNR